MVPGSEVAERPAGRPWAYPEVTRLLLAFDGSAGRLLAALVGTPVHAVPDGQERVEPAAVPLVVREALAVDGAALPLVLRRDRLVTPEGATLAGSQAYLPAHLAESLTPPPGVPLLRHLAQRRLLLGCRPVSFAPRSWPYGPARPWSVGRDYLVDCRGGGRLWVSEQFSPERIPAAAAPGPAPAPDLSPLDPAPAGQVLPAPASPAARES
ncbi:hypothetical protein OG455_21495 [Kitasatospora sp. NBC_01287]|uniref:hypothetical protein n=1 Tax=Kitasatospora sp. NBC_01287 TaxID=2903573 RepID=UPI00224CA422|nr:hypothetical protein [Kitasatospora sp. NBC_01287]MCX4748057.1 hypothetical protein [Kitasatospora sp. NBC_01287]